MVCGQLLLVKVENELLDVGQFVVQIFTANLVLTVVRVGLQGQTNHSFITYQQGIGAALFKFSNLRQAKFLEEVTFLILRYS